MEEENNIERLFGELDNYKKAIEDAKEALAAAEAAAGFDENEYEFCEAEDPEDDADWLIIF